MCDCMKIDAHSMLSLLQDLDMVTMTLQTSQSMRNLILKKEITHWIC